MVFEFEERGKLFTEFIPKDAILSIIQSSTHRIQGFVHIRKGERLSDEINNANHFLAITGAEIYSPEGEVIYTSDFLAINRECIVWLMPIEDHRDKSE